MQAPAEGPSLLPPSLLPPKGPPPCAYQHQPAAPALRRCRFIYLVGCTGGYAFATALCGLAGVKRERRLQLGAYILLLALLVSVLLWGSRAVRALV